MEKPLVTISIITYNQERYVRDAVRGLLSQTYEPLEIVISDDHSTDQTWDIITDEIASYKKNGGVHKNIVLNRNEKNLGIARHCDVVRMLKHGVLRVSGGGDDVSLPERVQRIVDAWENSGRKATRIDNQAVMVDLHGAEFGLVSGYGKYSPLGAAMTYHQSVFEIFRTPLPEGAYEDMIYGVRALMIGEYVSMPDVLLKYRVGDGVSTALSHWRKRKAKMYRSAALSCRFVLSEVESYKENLSEEKYREISSQVNQRLIHFQERYDLYGGEMFGVRLRAFKKVHPPMQSLGLSMFLFLIVQLAALIPCACTDVVSDVLMRLKFRMKVQKEKWRKR